MAPETYTVELTRDEVLSIIFELETLAKQHEERAARDAALSWAGYSPATFSAAYWRAQADNCKSVMEKLNTAMGTYGPLAPGREV